MKSDFLMDNRCFACGRENPIGLHLDIKENKDGVYTKIRLSPEFQGYQRVIHGGIVSTILDEMAVWASYKKGYKAVTAELNMRIRKPMLTEVEYIATGRIITIKHKLVVAQAEIKDYKEGLIACADVKLIRIE